MTGFATATGYHGPRRPSLDNGRCSVTDPTSPDEQLDPTADTAKFKAFVAGDAGAARPARVGVPFRLLTLLAGLVVLGGLVWLLFLL